MVAGSSTLGHEADGRLSYAHQVRLTHTHTHTHTEPTESAVYININFLAVYDVTSLVCTSFLL